MAQASPKAQQVAGMSDVSYDLVSTLAEDLEAVDVLNTYIEDARKAGDQDAESIFCQIRDDELRHCDVLRRTIEARCCQGKFQ